MSSEQVDVLLVAVTQVEVSAILDLAKEKYGYRDKRQYIGDKTYYDLDVIGGARIYLVRSEMGSGGPGGSSTTVLEGIRQMAPAAVIMVGIAFGIDSKKQNIGDVLVSRQILSYELQRIGTGKDGQIEIKSRGDRPPASPRLLDRFRDGALFWKKTHVRFGLVLSGQKLVDNRDYRSLLLGLEPEAIGGEMEGAGLFDASYLTKTDWILVKAICDWADGSKVENEDERQNQAAANAASFVFHVLERGGLSPTNLPLSETPPSGGKAERVIVPETSGARLAVSIDPKKIVVTGLKDERRRLIVQFAIINQGNKASEEGAMKLTIASPMIFSRSTQTLFASAVFRSGIGLKLRGYEDIPIAQSMKIFWGSSKGTVIFPNDTHDFRGTPVSFDIPYLTTKFNPTYVFQVELMTTDNPTQTMLFALSQLLDSDRLEVSRIDHLDDEVYFRIAETFWATFHEATHQHQK